MLQVLLELLLLVLQVLLELLLLVLQVLLEPLLLVLQVLLLVLLQELQFFLHSLLLITFLLLFAFYRILLNFNPLLLGSYSGTSSLSHESGDLNLAYQFGILLGVVLLYEMVSYLLSKAASEFLQKYPNRQAIQTTIAEVAQEY